jgi:integrase
MGKDNNRSGSHGRSRGVAAGDSPGERNQVEDPKHHERALQPRHSMGIYRQESHHRPCRGSGVRQSAKRERIPDLLEVEEFQLLQAELRIRERILAWLDMTLGLRRGELAGLRWEDIHFEELTVMAQRSVVDQVVGRVKTEASKRPIPIDPFIAEDLLLWYRTTKYNRPDDYVFATDAARAGKKRGKQPVWLSKVMSYRIQPVAKRLGIAKRIGWHTFRRTLCLAITETARSVPSKASRKWGKPC